MAWLLLIYASLLAQPLPATLGAVRAYISADPALVKQLALLPLGALQCATAALSPQQHS